MTIKRKTQYLLRKITSLTNRGSLYSENFDQVKDSLQIRNPLIFDKAVFNFTIDFELIWGNGNIDGSEHSYERRLSAASLQRDCFNPFVKLCKDLKIPITWAIIGKLVNQKIPEDQSRFSPTWARDWYDNSYCRLEANLWDGKEYINAIKNNSDLFEVKSHGHSHIDYSDSSVTESVARWDMREGIEALRNEGFEVNGLVYPCNKHNFKNLLLENNIQIIRGEDKHWKLEQTPVETPLGFWISPAFYSLSEIIELIDIAVEKKSFFHPWMHLVECDLKQNDIKDFYRPIFEYVLKLKNENKIEVLHFKEIFERLS